jgi:hypothetical protein
MKHTNPIKVAAYTVRAWTGHEVEQETSIPSVFSISSVSHPRRRRRSQRQPSWNGTVNTIAVSSDAEQLLSVLTPVAFTSHRNNTPRSWQRRLSGIAHCRRCCRQTWMPRWAQHCASSLLSRWPHILDSPSHYTGWLFKNWIFHRRCRPRGLGCSYLLAIEAHSADRAPSG